MSLPSQRIITSSVLVTLSILTMPWWLPLTGILNLVDGTFIALHTIIVVGLVLLVGHSGQISIGQGAFFGVGAYTSAILTATYGWPTLAAGVASIVATIVIAAIVGLPTLRLTGHFLALATLGLGLIAQVILLQTEFTGRATGISGVPTISLFGWQIDSDRGFLYMTWAVAILAMIVAHRIVTSRTGRALRALADSPAAAESSGIVLGRYKLMAFVLAAVFAGIAGSLYAHTVSFGLVSPSPFGINASILVLIMVVVGGVRSVWTAPFGVAVVTGLESALERLIPKLIPSAAGDFQIIGFGMILVIFLSLAPGGLGSLWRRFSDARSKRRIPTAELEGVVP